jgi:hypothetical protein
MVGFWGYTNSDIVNGWSDWLVVQWFDLLFEASDTKAKSRWSSMERLLLGSEDVDETSGRRLALYATCCLHHVSI